MHNAKINKSKKFNIWGSGDPLREFLFVDDLTRFIEILINTEIEEDLINVGSGKEIKIKELAKIIQNIVNYDGNIVLDNSKPDGNPRKLLDSTIARSYGWEPKLNLEDGLLKLQLV